MNSGEQNIFFDFPGYYGHGVPENYCHTNESSLVQNNSKNKEAKIKNQNRRPGARNGQQKKLKCLYLYGKRTLQNHNLIKLQMYGVIYQQRYLRLVMESL